MRTPAIAGAPHPQLRPLLSRDHGGFTDASPPAELVLPATAAVPLVVKLRDSAHRPPEFTTGAHAAPLVMEGACAPAYIEVWLAPLGAYTLLGAPIERLSGQIVDLTELFGPDGRRLAESVRDAPTWARRFELIDAFLLRRLDRGPRPHPEVARAWQRLVATGGRAPIGDIATEVGWSHRHLVARFRHEIGVTPKTAARLVRFECVRQRLETTAPVRWADLAAEAGYADQSHLVREFRTFTGSTPTQYLAAATHA